MPQDVLGRSGDGSTLFTVMSLSTHLSAAWMTSKTKPIDGVYSSRSPMTVATGKNRLEAGKKGPTSHTQLIAKAVSWLLIAIMAQPISRT